MTKPGNTPEIKSAGETSNEATVDLLAALQLERLEDNLFRGISLHQTWQRVYGGQVLGQAISAACQTVAPSRTTHSLHGYFLLGGDPQAPIVYDVENVRDGGSFSTRRVKAIQHGNVIFTMSASFHDPEPGLDHQAQMPEVPPPDELLSAQTLFSKASDKLPAAMQAYWSRPQPIDMRPIDISRYLKREARPPVQYIWLRANGELPDDPAVHQSVLAYASDFTLLDTALIAHGKLLFDRDMQLASLDHALWFHRPFKADDWLLYAQDSPNSHGARGFCRGQLFNAKGELVASTAQEGLMRQRQLP